MRFMIIRRADVDAEAGTMPGEAMLAAMGAHNQATIDAGVFRAGESLRPSAKGARIRFSGRVARIIDGLFAGTREVVAGFTIHGWGFGGAVVTGRGGGSGHPGSYGWMGGFGTGILIDPPPRGRGRSC